MIKARKHLLYNVFFVSFCGGIRNGPAFFWSGRDGGSLQTAWGQAVSNGAGAAPRWCRRPTNCLTRKAQRAVAARVSRALVNGAADTAASTLAAKIDAVATPAWGQAKILGRV
jgi:hypothetical protein